jgi:hypothetical protein
MSACPKGATERLDKPKLPPITDLPRESWDAVDRYLGALIAQARIAAARSGAAAKIDPTGCFAANAAYWRNAAGAFRWFRGQLRRQRTAHERGNRRRES